MNIRRTIGLIIFIVGTILILSADYQQNQIAESKGYIQKGSSLFSGCESEVGRIVSSTTSLDLTSYKVSLRILNYAGIVLVIIGASMALSGQKKKA